MGRQAMLIKKSDTSLNENKYRKQNSSTRKDPNTSLLKLDNVVELPPTKASENNDFFFSDVLLNIEDI